MELIVTCIPGLAGLLAEELGELGLDVTPAGVAAVRIEQVALDQALRFTLWSRLAERVLMPIGQVEATPDVAAEQLAKLIDIDDHLGVETPLNVHVDHEAGVRGDPRISSSVFCRNLSRRVILQREPAGALCLRILIAAEQASVSIDFSGVPLSRRGYRVSGGAAPLRESLAAAMLRVAGWPNTDAPVLIDPFCGSGTVPIEAALIAKNVAPGLMRENFSVLQWRGCRSALWTKMREEARAQVNPNVRCMIKGFDGDDQALRLAKANADRAGVESMIHFERREMGLLASRDFADNGVIVTNPPWGERLEDRPRVVGLHQALGRKMAALARGWPMVVLGSEVEVLDKLGAEHVAQWKLRNGAMNNYIRKVSTVLRAPATPLQTGEAVFELPEQAQALANRLRKNGRQLRKWIQQEQITSYRLYDRDLPEFNFSIDVYAEQVCVQEFAPPKTIDEKLAEQRRMWAVSAVRSVLGAHREQVFLRTRSQQKGKQQYQKLDARKEMSVVREGQAYFYVNLSAYLDTGLFLDHRPTRMRFETECSGKRFLNLFGYTGAATVHAAVGGARSSVTVDSSKTYLDWAGENLALNGFSTRNHRLERADTMTWLQACNEQFDVVFCDPPTFSNNKSRDDFVVQRDHAELIRWIMKRLEPGGVLYFSNNFRKFKLDEFVSKWFKVEDLTRGSVPPDFNQQATPHHLFAIRHLD